MRISDWSSDVCSSDLLGVALVFGVHHDGHVAQHGFGAGGGNYQMRDVADRSFQRVADFPHETVFFLADDFKIGHGRNQYRIPVHQALAAIDKSLPLQLYTGLDHTTRQVALHGSVFSETGATTPGSRVGKKGVS